MDVDDIIDYEDGEMDEDRYLAMFQDAVNSGSAWRMQGSYGREAMALIEAGKIMLGEQGNFDYYGNYVPSRYEVLAGTKGSVEYCEAMNA